MLQFLKKDTALATAAVYESMFAEEDGSVPATFQVTTTRLLNYVFSVGAFLNNSFFLFGYFFQVIYMTGWREHSSQQKAKKRGSATVSFQDIKNHFGSNNS